MNNKSAQQRKNNWLYVGYFISVQKKYVNVKKKISYMDLPLKFHIFIAFYTQDVSEIGFRIPM